VTNLAGLARAAQQLLAERGHGPLSAEPLERVRQLTIALERTADANQASRLHSELLRTPLGSEHVDDLSDAELMALIGPGASELVRREETGALPQTVIGLQTLERHIAAAVETDARRVAEGELADWPDRGTVQFASHEHPTHGGPLSPLQLRWITHFRSKLDANPAWYFAQAVRVAPRILSEALGIPLQDLEPPAPPKRAAPAEPAEPLALPRPGTESIVIDPGVELLPAEREKPAPATEHVVVSGLGMSVGWHTINGERVLVQAPLENPTAADVLHPMKPGHYVIDGRAETVLHPRVLFPGCKYRIPD
jgi:hypothetical protein